MGQHYALVDLYNGFTTLQDMNSPFTYATVELRDAINKGAIVGPQLQVTGLGRLRGAPRIIRALGSRRVWTGPGDAGLAKLGECEFALARARSPFASIRTSEWTGSRFTRRKTTKEAGYPQPSGAGAFMPDGKMITVPSITLEENQAIVDEAHRRGRKFACHAYGGEGLRNCLMAGVDLPIHVIVGVTGAPGLDDETIRLFEGSTSRRNDVSGESN